MIKDFFVGPRYTEDELMARLKFFIGMTLALTLFGIVFVVLYSLIFVTQPMNGMSPVDNKFFELIIPIATFLTGTLSGIMLAHGDKEAQKQALAAANKGWDRPPSPPPSTTPTVTIGSGSVSIGQPSSGNQVVVGFGGKMAPPPQQFPEI
jgi:Na+-transporting methylmalonyl-CoA/oxaloacetate decarboxylase gamma subunit